MLSRRLVAASIASLGWTALGLQLYFNLEKAIINESLSPEMLPDI
jgi:hypothetical protein